MKVFPSVDASFHIPPGNMWVFQFLHIPANICYSLFWIKAILVGREWYLHVILICISLLSNDVEHLFMCSLATCISSLEKFLFKSILLSKCCHKNHTTNWVYKGFFRNYKSHKKSMQRLNLTDPQKVAGGLVAKSCPTLTIPWTVACQDPLSMGFSRQEYWSGLPCLSPGESSQPRNRTQVS